VLFEVDSLSGRSAKLEAFAELVRAEALAQPAQEPTLQEQLDEAYADMAQANADKEKASADCEKAYNEAKRIEKLIEEKNT
jgi:multidrug resistance efflux pump